jgi:hypothetical protein
VGILRMCIRVNSSVSTLPIVSVPYPEQVRTPRRTVNMPWSEGVRVRSYGNSEVPGRRDTGAHPHTPVRTCARCAYTRGEGV